MTKQRFFELKDINITYSWYFDIQMDMNEIPNGNTDTFQTWISWSEKVLGLGSKIDQQICTYCQFSWSICEQIFNEMLSQPYNILF